DVLRVGPAQRGPQRLQALLLADDVVHRGRARLLRQRLRQRNLLHLAQFFHLLAGLALDGRAAGLLRPQQVQEVKADDDGKEEVDEPEDDHEIHRRLAPSRGQASSTPRLVWPRRAGGKPDGNEGGRQPWRLPASRSGGFFFLLLGLGLAGRRHQRGRLAPQDAAFVDDDLLYVFAGRHFGHYAQHK